MPLEAVTRKITITEPQILLFAFLAVAVVALHLFLTRSRLGKAMRAMSDNADLARVSGIRTDVVVWTTWCIAGALAAAAGTLLSLDVTLKPDLSFNLLLPIFAAAIVGGVGKPYGAIAGGFVVGFAETLAVFNWTVLLRPIAHFVPAKYRNSSQIGFRANRIQNHSPFRYSGPDPHLAAHWHLQRQGHLTWRQSAKSS